MVSLYYLGMKGHWILSVITIGIILFSVTAYAQSSVIPDWVKNNAKWWSDGQIGESDYIQSLQYLISQGIIEIPITKVSATEVSLTDSDTAQSFVVHFTSGDYFTEEATIYTYSEFFHYSSTALSNIVPAQSQFLKQPEFLLRGLPSIDKQIIYGLVNEYASPGPKPIPFEVTVDVVTGDGNILQSWQYRNCEILDYSTYVDSNKDMYRYGKSDKMEIREVTVFSCIGFTLKT